MAEFVNLHVHDTYGSLLDSILRPEDIAKFAHDHGQPAIAVTNHGYMSSFVDFHKACLKYGVKPIHGCEIYECDNDQWRSDTKDYKQPRYHLVLLAKNKTGLQNLFKIVSFGCTEGFYKKPRISVERIKENDWGEGIICLTACQAGRVSKLLTEGKYDELRKFDYLLWSTFDNVYYELQSHDTYEQSRCNRLIQDYVDSIEGKCVITTDAHMLSPDQADSHSIFVEIGEGREVGEAYTDCYLQTRSNVYQTLRGNYRSLSEDEIADALYNITEIVDQIKVIDIGLTDKAIMPKVKIHGDFDSHEEYLRHLVYSTFHQKFGYMSIKDQEVRRARIEEELPVLYALEYTDYFIMLYMLIDAFRKAGIPLGYARGSAAGSLCLYMLNVTQIDSVRWKLDFSRFANLGRKSMADCDIDISKRRRREAVDIAAQLFGKENVAPICTFNTLSTKVAIRDIGKVLNEKEDSPYFGQIPYSLRDEVAKMIPTIKTLNDLGEEEEKDVLLRDILLKNDKLQEVYTQFPLWFKHIMVLEGLPKSMGRHAAGTLITPKPVVAYCPVCHDKDGNVMVQLEMHAAMDDLGLTKMDFLGLKTLDVVDDALHSANLTWDDVNIDHLNLDDQAVYSQVYQPGNTIGIFQMESYEARRMCIDSKADDVENIVVVNAANRPGTKDSFPEYCRNKLCPEQETPIHPDLSKMFKASHGILLYQEQALQVFRYAGFPEEEVDNARRCVDENSLIMMGDGSYKRIADIKVGDRVISMQEDGSFQSELVNEVFDNGIQDVYKIQIEHGVELYATGSHRLMSQCGFRRIDTLTSNDHVIAPSSIQSDYYQIPGNKKPSDSTMFLIGMLLGDGSLGNPDQVHFTNSELEVVKEYIRCIENLNYKHCNAEPYYSTQNGVGVDTIYSVYVRGEIAKKRLNSLLNKYDLFHKAAEKKLPDEFMKYSPTSKTQCLLAGLFNTDGGYVEDACAIEYYTKSKQLALQIKSLLLKYSIYSYIYSKTVPEYDYQVYTVRIQQCESLRNFVNTVTPYMVGRKKNDYIRMYKHSLKRSVNYNYILPKYQSNEIYSKIDSYGLTADEIGAYHGYNAGCFKIDPNLCLTDTKAWKLIQHCYCPNAYRMLSSDVRPLKIISIEKVGKSHVYDIEVDSTHNYVVNGIVSHNCIGKKDPEKMKALKVDLYKGLQAKDWSDGQCDAVWELLFKQASYSFNRSHAVAYGLLSYLTAYLKVHYPVEFISACLTNDSDNVSKISVFINEAKRIGIKVLPPHINKSGKYFTPIAENNEILFGLLAVKGIGESVVNQIIENRPYKNLKDFVSKIKGKTAVVQLIKAGAIPGKNKMQTLQRYAEMCYVPTVYKEVSTLPTKAKLLLDWDINQDDYKEGKKVNKERVLHEYNLRRLKAHEEKESKRRNEYMMGFYDTYCQFEFLWEFETLSMFVTHDPLCEANQYITTPWNKIASGEVGIVVCVVTDIENKKDKNGNVFAYIDLYTPYGIIESTCWSSQMKEYGHLIKKGKCLAIKGRKAEGEHLFVEAIKPYEQWLHDRQLKLPH